MAYIICILCQGLHQSKHSSICRACHVDEELLKVIETQRTKGKPTNHLPGSEGKILVMAERIENNQYLHHEKDAMISYKSWLKTAEEDRRKTPRGAYERKALNHLTINEDDGNEDIE